MQYVNLRSFSNKIFNRIESKLKKTTLISKPLEICLEPTLKCNSNCMMCNRNFERRETKSAEGMLSWDTFQRVKPFFKFTGRVLFSGFGEPFLHPHYLSMLREIKKYGPFVYLFTNGILMNKGISESLVDTGVDKICVSFGGASRDTYKKIRGIDGFDKVVENIQYINEYIKKRGKEKPMLSFNIVAMNSILPELVSVVALAHKLGVKDIDMPNLVVQGKAMFQESVWHNVEKAKNIFTQARALAERYQISFRAPDLEVRRNDCRDLFRKLLVTWDGKVLSCANERFLLGDLSENKITDIWNSRGVKKLRKDYYHKGLEVLCSGCTNWDNRPETFLNPWVNSRDYAVKVY